MRDRGPARFSRVTRTQKRGAAPTDLDTRPVDSSCRCVPARPTNVPLARSSTAHWPVRRSSHWPSQPAICDQAWYGPTLSADATTRGPRRSAGCRYTPRGQSHGNGRKDQPFPSQGWDTRSHHNDDTTIGGPPRNDGLSAGAENRRMSVRLCERGDREHRRMLVSRPARVTAPECSPMMFAKRDVTRGFACERL